MAAFGNLLTVYNLEASIGTSKSEDTWSYAKLEAGLDNVSEALNEVVQQYFFLNDKGFARNHVTGMAPAFTMTGRRVQGDAAQDYIFSKKYKLDSERSSSFQLKVTDNSGVSPKVTTYTVDCTICNIQEFSGASTDDSAISFELRFNGAPVATTT